MKKIVLISILTLFLLTAAIPANTSHLATSSLNNINERGVIAPKSTISSPLTPHELNGQINSQSDTFIPNIETGNTAINPVEKLAPPLREPSNINENNIRYVRDAQGHLRVFILFKGTSTEFNQILNNNKLKINWVAPLAGGNILISASVLDTTSLLELARISGVKYVSPDFYIYDFNLESKPNTLVYGKNSYLKLDGNFETYTGSGSNFDVDAYKAVYIEDAVQAWNAGYSGENVTIAIVDTGVDYGVPNLNTSYKIENGNVLAFVPDGDGVALTPYTFTPYLYNGTYYIPTGGRTFLVYDGFLGFTFAVEFLEDFNVTNVKNENLNDVYHFGLFLEWLPTPYGIFGFIVPILVTDSNNDGVYDRVYIDVTGVLYDYAYLTGLPYKESWFDMKFEGPYYVDPNAPEKALVAVDVYNATYVNVSSTWVLNVTFGQDGYADFSLGVIGVPFLDTQGILATELYTFGITPKLQGEGIDPDGNYVGFMYDFYGHGTSCASTAAGRKVPFTFYFANDSTPRTLEISGIAPNATVMGVRALSWGYVIEGWFYAAGFDLNNTMSSLDYQLWVYTGKHKADVISNSWGISWVWAEYGGYMFAYDVISQVETSLSLPGYYWGYPQFMDSEMYIIYEAANITNYEPSLFVHAEGNGGPGYGTANTGPWSPLAIQVAASTTFHYRPVYSIEPAGTYDQVIWWSNRGPVVSGLAGPDVAAIGAYAFETVPLTLVGLGNLAWELFGGTSQATPMTAGAAAVVIQAFKSGPFAGWTPMSVKSALMLSSKDMGYDVFTQGAGRIDVYKAVLMALNDTSIDIAYLSDSVFGLAANTIGYFGTWDVGYVGLPFLFGGYLLPGDTVSLNLTTFSNYGNADPFTQITAETLRLNGTQEVSLWLDPAQANYTGYGGYYFWFDTAKLGVDLKAHDFVRIVYHTSDWFSGSVVYTAAWLINDTNGDGNVTRDEVRLINRFTGFGPIYTVEIGYPGQFTENIGIGAFVYIDSPMYLNFTILYYDYVPMPEVSFTTPTNDHQNMTITINVPTTALPGTYWGYLKMTTNETTIRIPIVYHVVARVDVGTNATYTASFTTDASTLPNYNLIQGYDIFWRAEVGEWRVYYFQTNESALVTVHVEWNDPASDAYIHVFDTLNGMVFYEETPYYLGFGWFEDRDPFGNYTELTFPVVGGNIYAIVVRAPVLSGDIFPVNLEISFKVEPRTGPYVEVLGYTTVSSLTSNIEWSAIIAAPEGYYDTEFFVDGNIYVEPSYIYELVYNGIFMEVSAELDLGLITEGNHTLSVGVFDMVGGVTWNNFTIIVDRTPGLINDVIVNGTSVINAPVFYSSSVSLLNINVSISDVSPVTGSITIFDYFGSVVGYYEWMFNYTSGTFIYTDTGLTANAVYNSGRDMWDLTFNFTFTPMTMTDNIYYIYVDIVDAANNYGYDMFELLDYDIASPYLVDSGVLTSTPAEVVFNITNYTAGESYGYSVYLYAGYKYEVNLTWDSLTTDLDLLIYDPYGDYVNGSFHMGSTPEIVTFEAPYTGYYTIYVSFWSGDPTTYYLTVTRLPAFGPIDYILETTMTAIAYFDLIDLNITDVSVAVNGVPTMAYSLVQIDDLDWEISVPLDIATLGEGVNNITATVTDQIGRTATYTIYIIKDVNPPTATISAPSVIEGLANITFTYSDNASGIDYAYLYLDGLFYQDVTGLTYIEFNSTMYFDGYHEFELLVADMAGHVTIVTADFIIDNSYPWVSITYPSTGTILDVANITVEWIGYDDAGIDHYEVSLDNTTWINVGLNTTYTFLGMGDGYHTVFVKAVDYAGHTAIDSVTVLVDTAAPTATLELPSGVQNGTFTINITVNDDNFAFAVLYIDGAPVLNVTVPGTHSLTLNASNFADGTHDVKLFVKDKAGKARIVSGTFETGYYAYKEAMDISNLLASERSSATANMAIASVIAVIVGILLGVIFGRRTGG